MSEAERILAGMRERGYTGRAVVDTYICDGGDGCGETFVWAGVEPTPEMLSVCPSCGEVGDEQMKKVLVIGDPVVLSEWSK